MSNYICSGCLSHLTDEDKNKIKSIINFYRSPKGFIHTDSLLNEFDRAFKPKRRNDDETK